MGESDSPLTIVAPITSQPRKKSYPTEVAITARESGLKVDSWVLLAQIRTIDKSRLVKKLGTLFARKMKEVDIAIRVSLGLQ